MRHPIQAICAVVAAAAAAGCAVPGQTVLVFGQTQTVGLSIGGTVSDQGASFTLGYQDKNFAIVPATVAQANGSSSQVLSTVGKDGKGGSDALSVLGQFEVRSSTRTADVGLGKFFATGLAAQKLADGFSDQIAGSAARAASGAQR
jgi:hypothetical protein